MLGFILFYAPGALFTKAIFYLFGRDINEISIHSSCFRIQIEHLLDGKFFAMDIAFVSFLVVLGIISFFKGAIFCGKLCPAGASTEYLSRLIPTKYKINWSNM